MNQIDIATRTINRLIDEPTLLMFLVAMGLVGFSLYVVLQSIKKKE
jgi:hypothetical protein